MKLFPINIGNFKLDGGAMFGVVPKTLWQRKYIADENNMCVAALRSLLIDTGKQVILIDTGHGDKQDEKFFSHIHLHGGDGLIGGIEKAGYSAGDITDVVHTHLHADHCGGSTKYNNNQSDILPVFSNATYWVSKAQWEWAINPNPREKAAFLKENLLPMEKNCKLKFINQDTELYPGIMLKIFNGHTIGQMIPFISYKDKTVVFMADLIGTTAHLPLIYNMAYDIQPLITLKEKEAFLQEAVKNDYVLFFQHDAYVECCTLQETAKGIREKDTFSLAEL